MSEKNDRWALEKEKKKERKKAGKAASQSTQAIFRKYHEAKERGDEQPMS